MPMVKLKDVEINYELEGDGPETIVLINGLADDLTTWYGQMEDLLGAGYRVLRFDNRGIGKSSRPKGLYTTAMMAADAKALVDHLKLRDFHLVGVSMGGMISQEYALAYQGDLRSLTLCCTYAAPGPFCSRMFKLWQDMAPVMGVPAVMRDVTLWAFTQEFFLTQEATLKEFEAAMAALDQPVEVYLSQLNSIQTHDTRARLKSHQGADHGAGRRRGHPHPDEPVARAAQPHPRRGVRDRQGRARLYVGAPEAVQRGGPGLHRKAPRNQGNSTFW